MDNLNNSEGVGLPFELVEQGFAYAASSYGEGGFAVKKGMIRTLQLTMYSLVMLRWQSRCYHDVKVFLVGGSMGGTIALLLGEKYPVLYDGVLDIVGLKNVTDAYVSGVAVINSPMFQYLPPDVQALLLQFNEDIVAACGGTVEEKPKAYERLSPVCHPNIRIPVISVHGAQDPLLSQEQALSYGIAVDNAGRSEYYREYTIDPGAHADPPVIDAALAHLEELVNYPLDW
jgi:pimeloyl-ACP methyl ester carboxylesterase